MDLYQIRYFLTIAETGTFSRAAERLYVSQPSLSAGIKKLEQELGVTLFERGGRRTVLTAAGRTFEAKASIIMMQYQEAIHELKGFEDDATLRIGVLSSMRVSLLAKLVSSFQQHHPQVTVELHDGSLAQLQKSLAAGEVDVTITVLSMTGISDQKLSVDRECSTVLFQQPLWLAVPFKHPFSQRNSVRLADLDGQLMIDRIHCEFFPQECQLLDAANVKPKVMYRASHEEWVISLIQEGLGISVMPYWQGLPGVIYVPLSDVNLQRVIGVQWRSQQQPDIVKEFCNFAASHDWNATDL